MPDNIPVHAYIALGSNLNNPLNQVTSAVKEIQLLPNTEVIAVSRWFRSEPLKSAEQTDFINGAIKLSTHLSPLALLDHLQHIENSHHRQRTERWGSRTLDLDIILFGDQVIHIPRLTIPHPEMANRNFVLLPLQDLNPTLNLPDGTSLHKLLEICPTRGIVAVDEGGLSGNFN